jgi:hypothetical protein
MTIFSIYFRGKLIGHSKLESGDAPMGVASGLFIPNDAYLNVKSEIIGTSGNQDHLELTASTEEGFPIHCVGVVITDLTEDLGSEGLYIEVLGIPYPDYEEIFPQHVSAYKKQFPE